MADRLTHDVQHMSRQVKVISGIISIVGASSASNNVVTKSVGLDGVASVARTGTGAITITLSDKWVACHGILVSKGGASTRVPVVTSHDVASAKTVVVTMIDEDLAAEDTPNGTTDFIHVAMFLKNSSVI